MSTIHPPEYQQSPAQPLPLSAPPKRHRVRKALLIIGSAFAALIALIVIISVATNGKSTPTPTPTPTASSTTSTTATPTAPSASQQLTAWFNGGGSAQIKVISNDTGTLQTDLQAYAASSLADGTTLQADDATFQADVQAAQANLPPAGIAGLRSDYSAADVLQHLNDRPQQRRHRRQQW